MVLAFMISRYSDDLQVKVDVNSNETRVEMYAQKSSRRRDCPRGPPTPPDALIVSGGFR